MKKNSSLLILLLIAFVVWALNDFSLDIVVIFTAIGAVLAFISSVLDTAKKMDGRFSKEPSESPIKELLNSPKPLKVQVVHPEPPPIEKAEVLRAIRSLGSNAAGEQLEAAVMDALGENSGRFWEQVKADETLSSLARNGFWLEGLVLVFEQNKNSFPKNNGLVLSQVLLNQWTEEKLGIKKAISLEFLQTQLGELVRWKYPAIRYPGSHEGRVRMFRPYTEYEQIVVELGDIPSRRTSILGTYVLLPLIQSIFKDPNVFFQKLGNLSSPWKEIVILPFYLLLDPLSFLKNLLVFPFAWLERVFERFANDYDRDTHFRNSLNSFWHDKYLPFKRRVWRFVDRFSISRNRKLHRSKILLECTKKTGILSLDDEHIWFTEKYWRDYFKAVTITSDDAFDYFLKKHSSYFEKWQGKGEEVAIMVCGLQKDPEKRVEQVLQYAPMSASKCLLTLENVGKDVHADLKNKILEKLVAGIRTIQHDGNSGFCIRSIRAMRSLSNSSYYAHVALEKIPDIYDHDFHPQAAKLVASFGPPVLDMVMEKAKTEDPHIVRMMLIALGELKDTHAIRFLQGLLGNAENVRVRTMAAVVLAACFKDEAGISVLEKLLRFEHSEAKEHNPWFDLAIVGEDAIAFGLDLMERSSVPPSDRRISDPWPRMGEQFLKILERDYQDNPKVETMLLDVLERSGQLRLTHFVIEALGKVKSRKAIPELTRFLVHEDDYARQLALSALKQWGDEVICSDVIGLLYSSNLQLVKDAISTLSAMKCLDAIPALIEKLDSEEIEKYYDNDDGYPIALHAAEGLMAIGKGIGEEQAPVKVRKDAAEACLNTAADWFNAHLEDKRQLRIHYKTVASQSLWQLYILKASNEKAYDYYFEWIRKHPEDSI